MSRAHDQHYSRAPRDSVSSFRLLILADFISSFGSAMTALTVMLYIFSQTHSLLLASIFSALILAPRIAMAPLVAKIRFRRSFRTIFIGCELLSALLIAVLLINNSLPVIFLIFTAQQIPFFIAECYRAEFLKAISTDSSIYRYQGISQGVNMLVQVAAPVTGGLLLTYQSVRSVYLLDILSYVSAAIIISFLGVGLSPVARDHSPQPEKAHSAAATLTLLKDMFFGRNAFIYWGAIASTCAGTVGSVVTIIYVKDVLHQLDFHYTLLASISAVGVIAGLSLANIPFFQRRARTVAIAGNILVGVVMCLALFQPKFWVLLALMFLSGMGGGIFSLYITSQLYIRFDQSEILERYAYFSATNELSRVAANPLAAGLERIVGPIWSLVSAGLMMFGVAPLLAKATLSEVEPAPIPDGT